MPAEHWLELTIRSPLEPDLVSPALLELGGSAVEEREGVLVTYLPPPEELEEFLDAARRHLKALSPSAELDLSWRWQPQKDWESFWRRGLGTRRITERLLVVPSWEQVAPEPGQIALLLDPGMAFGTAEHATTRGCLRLLDSRVSAGSRIADVGAGSGILSIAAAHLGAGEVLALEVDGIACETALENVSRNGVEDRVKVLEVQVEGGTPLSDAPFDGIVANLQSHLLRPLLSTFRVSLLPEGWLVMSGILLEERDEILSAASAEGFILHEGDEEDGWWTGAFGLTRSPH
ncbi:MAG: 50S ribosomal protein L11 methyltransferase [Gemmatimonadota bacterium]